ncbi:MAG: flippase-like domain-containing protein [Gemmatimonadetes bacterium]|nr:flippase-like domain-containing protein [Gemmatimonadota bacterium]
MVVSVAAVAFIARALRRDGPAALEAWRAASVQWRWIAVALACAFSGHAWYVLGWQRLLRDLGVRASFVALARLFLVSNLGRYLPGGKAWQMAIIAAMATDSGLPPARVAASSLGQGVVGMGVGVLVLVAAGGSALGVSPVLLAFSLAGVVALLLGPASVRALPQLAAGIERRVPGITTVTARTMWTLLWTATASWLLWGVALYALGRAVLPLAGLSLVTSVTAWTGSFLAGLLLVIAPAGLGAREGVMQAVLARAVLPASDILVVVVLARVGVTLLDLIPALLVLAWRRRGTSRAAAHDHA